MMGDVHRASWVGLTVGIEKNAYTTWGDPLKQRPREPRKGVIWVVGWIVLKDKNYAGGKRKFFDKVDGWLVGWFWVEQDDSIRKSD